MPPGLSLASDGVISGTPTALGKFTFTATVVDSQSAGRGHYLVDRGDHHQPGAQPHGNYAARRTRRLTIYRHHYASNGLQPYVYNVATVGGDNPLTDIGLTLTNTPG